MDSLALGWVPDRAEARGIVRRFDGRGALAAESLAGCRAVVSSDEK